MYYINSILKYTSYAYDLRRGGVVGRRFVASATENFICYNAICFGMSL